MITFGIIGTNWITHSYILGAQSTSRFTLRAVYSRTEDSAKTFASQYADQKVNIHTTLESLAADPDISTVYIASPNSLHYEHAKQMLEAGKDVILEKPACSNIKELDELFKLAYSKKLILIEAYRHVQEANFKILKSAIADGKIGTIHGARLDFIQFSSRYDKLLSGEQPPPNLFTLTYGGGCLADLGVYNVSAALELFGSPHSFSYHPVILPQTGADGAGTLLLTYKNPNFVVSLTASKMYSSPANVAAGEIYGSEGTLVVPTITDIESVKLYLHRKKGDQGTELAGPKEPAELNLKEEAEVHAGIIEGRDVEGMKRWEGLSRGVIRVTEGVRRANGLLFPGEE